MFAGLLACRDAARPRLRWATTGGAPMPEEWKSQFLQSFGVPVQDGYGLTEAAPLVCFESAAAGIRPGSTGPPIGPARVRITDPSGAPLKSGERGEVEVGGACLMDGYLGDQAATRAVLRDGWLKTGDLGSLEEDGRLYLAGRSRDLILRGGYSIYPAEVEAALQSHPSVLHACCAGIPHQRLGQEIGALVELRPGADVSENELLRHAALRLAPFRRPRLILITEQLPRGATGKVARKQAAELLSEAAAQSSR